MKDLEASKKQRDDIEAFHAISFIHVRIFYPENHEIKISHSFNITLKIFMFFIQFSDCKCMIY